MKEEKLNSFIEDCITKALYQLIDKKPFDKITITEIVEKAGVSRISFYRHFDSKLDILNKKLNQMTDEFINDYYKDINNQNVEENLLNLFNIIYKYKDLGTALYKSNSQYLIQQQFHKVIDERISKFNIYKRSFYAGGIYNSMLLWISTGYKQKPEFLVETIMDILKAGF